MTFRNRISVCTLEKNGGNYILTRMKIWRLICHFEGYTQYQIIIDIDPIPINLSDFKTAIDFLYTSIISR